MEGGSAFDGDSLPVFASIASVLGVQGPLRFRPHGASQKAHVVLRRVIVSDSSSDNGSGKNVVRFSLYAQKRIEVKPGKEILLTVAEGVFKDQAIVLEADLTDPGEVSDGKPAADVVEEEEAPILPPVVPPKMRRAWTRRGEEPNVVVSPPVRTSIGIQAQPSYSSVQTQCQPQQSVHATQTSCTSVSHAVQVNPQPLPLGGIRISSSVQTGDTIKYASSLVQTDLSDKPKEKKSSAEVVEVHDSFHKEPVHERSLSPMELDSVASSPVVSPNSTPKMIRSQPERFATPPRSPASSIASSSGFQDIPADPPPYVNGVNGAEPKTKYQGSVSSDPSTSAPAKTGTGVHTNPSPLNQSVNGKAGAKKPVYNNFVPAKHATGPSASMEGNAPETPEISPITQMSVSALSKQPLPTGNASKFSSSDKSSAVGKPNSLPQNAFASTSRNTSNQVDVPAHNKHPLPNSSKLPSTLSARAHQKSPVLAMKLIPTPGPSNGSSIAISPNDQPPPDPKALAYIPVGPSFNPLGIKPSLKSSTFRPLKHDPPIGPKALTQATKKRIVVGTGWSAARGTTSSNNSTSSASIPPSSSLSLPSAPPQASSAYMHHAKAVDLSHIVSYSPSPPPFPPPPSPAPPSATPATKWKRVNEDSLGEKSGSPGCGPPPVLKTSSLSTQPSFVSASQSPLTPSTPPESPYLPCPIPALLSSKKKYPIGQDVQGKSSLLDPLSLVAPAPLHSEQSPIIDSTASTTSPISTTVQANKVRPPISLSSPARLSLYNSQRVNSIPFASPSGSITPSGPSTPSIPPTLVHPLPPRPVQACPAPRGIKRERPPSPELIPEGSRPRRRRTFRWPTVDSSHAVKLEGEGTVAIRTLAFSSDGEHFALSCDDRTVRIWNNRTRVEVARLSHNSSVIAALWMDGDEGVIALSEDGLVSKWTRDGPNKWKWAKMVHAGSDNRLDDEPLCLAYARDRIAVSFPRLGVKVWFWLKGTWQPQRSILRPSVSAIRFVEDGEAIVGGTREGVLWYSQIPNGTLRAYAFLKSKINSIDVTPTGSHIIIGHSTGAARLVAIRQADNKGSIEQSYSSADTERSAAGFGAVFATKGQAILFGSVDGCVLVWDRKKGTVVYGLEHEEGDIIQAVASFDGRTSKDGCLVTGTKFGQISWWAQPVAAPTPDDSQKAKRAKKA